MPKGPLTTQYIGGIVAAIIGSNCCRETNFNSRLDVQSRIKVRSSTAVIAASVKPFIVITFYDPLPLTYISCCSNFRGFLVSRWQ